VIEETGPETAAEIAGVMGAEGDLVEARLDRGCRCLAVRSGGEVAGYGWLSTGPEWIGELGLEIRPAPGEIYVWNCVTLPAHRRRGLFRALLQTAVGSARREGLGRLWIGTVDGVGESAVADAGFAPVLSIDLVEVSRLGWLSVRSAAGADAVAVAAALASLAGQRERLRSGLRAGSRRRH
jgi:GNAT superfamily N-acetyltransferase